MSKAFVKDDAPAEEIEIRRRDVTDGAPNHMTLQGFEALKRELVELQARPDSATDARRKLVAQILESANVIDPSLQKGERVLFGATVTVSDEDGVERVYKIVGVDETNAAAGKVSWISPVGKALLQARVGDEVNIKLPQKSETLEILKIEFIPIL